jgi:hypothetical protein
MHLRALLFLASAASCGVATPLSAQRDDLQATYDFLVKERNAGGALFTFEIAGGNYALPHSYIDSAAYWAAYVCEGSAQRCAVHDTYDPLSYQLTPAPGPAGERQVERVNAHNGANIYDAAAWQIAVVLGAVKGHLRQSSPTSAYALANGLTEVLHRSGSAAAVNPPPGGRRAETAASVFLYNGHALNGPRAFAFRALAPAWLARDPLMGSPHASWITAGNLPEANPAYAVGRITWTDWKPIAGENAWAFLIGPLQAAYIHHVISGQDAFIPFRERAVQNALAILPTFAAMQSTIGAVYYAPAGTIGNEGDRPVDPHQVSVENNFSLYAGLRLLRWTLQAALTRDTALADAEKATITDALALIDVMIAGGRHAKVGKDGRTKGLLSFFRDAAWHNGGFVQGGLADDPAQTREWVPTTTPLAVDVQTWGIAALGAKEIDGWFGFGASYAMWQRLKGWGGYGVGQQLWGVGFSDQDGNGIEPSGTYRQGVLSGEWTAGAITAVRNMISLYGAEPRTSPRHDVASKHVARLKQDEAAMLKALAALRIDRYAVTDFPEKPIDYAELISSKTKPYLYASRRYRIPFGWYANPLPSTASTAWVVMLAYGYDPFGIGGAPN